MRDNMKRAHEITSSVEANIVDLIDKLCEGEPKEVRGMVWTELATHMAFLSGHGDCFILPPIDEC